MAANSRLREAISDACQKRNLKLSSQADLTVQIMQP